MVCNRWRGNLCPSHSIKGGMGSCSFPSMDSMMKLTALPPEVSDFPGQVFRVFGVELGSTSKRLKNSVLAGDLLLCSSNTAYILIAFSFMPAGYARHILEQRKSSPFPQISIHLEVTKEDELSLCSSLSTLSAIALCMLTGGGPGCRAVIAIFCHILSRPTTYIADVFTHKLFHL